MAGEGEGATPEFGTKTYFLTKLAENCMKIRSTNVVDVRIAYSCCISIIYVMPIVSTVSWAHDVL